jgi:hypothetical protein
MRQVSCAPAIALIAAASWRTPMTPAAGGADVAAAVPIDTVSRAGGVPVARSSASRAVVATSGSALRFKSTAGSARCSMPKPVCSWTSIDAWMTFAPTGSDFHACPSNPPRSTQSRLRMTSAPRTVSRAKSFRNLIGVPACSG